MINRESATICFPEPKSAIGGSHISVLGLIRNLDRRRYRPLILPQRPDGAVAALFREHRIEIEQSFHWTEPPFDMRIDARTVLRSEERQVGTECVRTCIPRWAANTKKNKND